MLKKVLIANRGEIALRIVRACRDLGIASVAVYSDADAELPFVALADERVHIGASPAQESYLRIDKLIDAAKRTGADAVHPGYGFLSENAALARAVRDASLVFVGPPAEVIEALGSKLAVRRLMRTVGVPILPGSEGPTNADEARALAEQIGFPLLVKPSGGGGGRGMRAVKTPAELDQALQTAGREAARSFGDSEVYIEKLLTRARHIEVQILADQHGNLVHVGDRDCSLQRRHQKVVEEAPAPGLSAAQHEQVQALAIRAAAAAGYVNAGTVEFLFDGQAFYLLEVNTRIQVEHCVTEMVSGIDLVAEQLRIAAGERLSFGQDEIVLRGAAVQARLYAEDPARKFMPAPGVIGRARFPAGPFVREDRGFEAGQEITPFYDGMIAKLLAWGPTREIAIARCQRALREYELEGIRTNLGLLRWALDTPAFRQVTHDTGFLEREFKPEFLA